MIDAFLLAAIPALTVVIVGHADLRRGDCPDPIPAGRDCVAFKDQVMLVDKDAFVVFLGALVVLSLVLFVTVQGITGASPGKALLGVRVIRGDGAHPGALRSAVRVVAWLVDGLMLLLPVALWSAWLSPGTAGVGDWVAGTYVIRSRVRPPKGCRVDHGGWLDSHLWWLSWGTREPRRGSPSCGSGSAGRAGR